MIYDPTNPPLIFDGLLDVYSTCRDCGQLMKVITADQHSHPTCAIIDDQIESMNQLLLAEIKSGDMAAAALTEQLINEMSKVEIAPAAVTFTEWMWPVFPLAINSKIPAIPKPKGHGFKDATTDTQRIEKWWSRHPLHNIGLATGHMFDVIDVDTKDSEGNPSPVGVQSFLKCLTDGDLPETHAVAITASGGMHLYVKATGKGNFAGMGKNKDGTLRRPGVDYRGLGGYVVAPPSQLKEPGRQYTWLVEPSPAIKGDF